MNSFGISSAVAFLVALLTIPLLLRLAARFGFSDAPGLRKLHKTEVPNIGGVALILSLLAGFATLLGLNPDLARQFLAESDLGLWVLVAVMVMFLMGFVDDHRGLRVRHKLLIQILVAVGLCAAGVRIDEIIVTGSVRAEFGWLSWPLTVLWIVGLTNAINLIDGLDGLAASLALVGCATLALLGFVNGQPILAGMSLAMLGGLLGFLVFNFHPAKIFMGDGGSLSLGIFLAAGSVLSLQAKHSYPSFALPCLALGIPILDATYCVVRRVLDRRSPFAPDRGHVHHRMLDLGLGQRKIVLLMLGVTLVSAGLGSTMLVYQRTARFIVFVAAASVLFVFLWGVGYFQFRKTLNSLWEMHSMGRERRHAQRAFETLQLQMREAATFDEWWVVVCNAAQIWEFESVEIEVKHREGADEVLSWRAEAGAKDDLMAATDRMHLSVPIAQRRPEQPLNVMVGIRTHGSLEGAASRFRLFARLIDEHGLANLVPNEGASDGEPANTA
ncbi:MAG: MraY family glycosyltransferase [Planctomycetota bacterium]|nr:MraY family glycosyltransferase [Planctomycetota bacterium]